MSMCTAPRACNIRNLVWAHTRVAAVNPELGVRTTRLCSQRQHDLAGLGRMLTLKQQRVPLT